MRNSLGKLCIVLAGVSLAGAALLADEPGYGLAGWKKRLGISKSPAPTQEAAQAEATLPGEFREGIAAPENAGAPLPTDESKAASSKFKGWRVNLKSPLAAKDTPRPEAALPDERNTTIPSTVVLQHKDEQEPAKDAAKETSKTEPPVVASSHYDGAEPCYYVFADYLQWWIRTGPNPVLLTTETPGSGSQGVLDRPGTIILFGENSLDYGNFSGGRIRVGRNFGADDFWSLELGGFALQSRRANSSAASDPNGNPLLVRPFLSVLDTAESGVETSNPDSAGGAQNRGSLQGQFDVESTTQLWGAEVNLIAHSIRDNCRRFDLIGGARFLSLEEDLRMRETLTTLQDNAVVLQPAPPGQAVFLDPNPRVGSVITTNDSFRAHNYFYGAQVGGRFQWNRDRWGLDLVTKIALGVTHQQVSIDGVTVLNDPGGQANTVGGILTPTAPRVVATPGGLLALTSNIGDYSREQFSVVPEIGLNARFALTPRIRTQIGYTGVYWSNVARPGDQIDRNVNPKLIPVAQAYTDPLNTTQEQLRPHFPFRDNGFWAHGLNVGLEIRY